jgi:hypothetical protein
MRIKVTDTCLTAGHKHTGSGLTGFIIGETFGWHCFSDDCEGTTIGTVFQILRDAVKDDGTPKYKPYPRQIFRDEGLETIREGLEEGWIELADENDDKAAKVEEKELDDALADRPELEPGVEPKESITLDGLDTTANNRATELLQIILHHPKETWSDGFIFFVKRVKEKLGFNAKYKKPKDGEVTFQTLSMPIGEVMRMVCKFCDKHRELPDIPTLIHFIDVSPDPDVRQNQFKTEMKTWLSSLAERPATMFDEAALALMHILDLRQEVRVWRTAFNWFLLKTQNIQDGRMTLKKYWNMTIGAQDTQFQQGSWQEHADDIYDEFAKNIRGENDERKCKLGFPTIDNAGGNIGLDGDRYICICGPSNNRKSTWMLSVAMNLAIQGKNVLFAAGEHSKTKVGKKLMLQLSHFYRDELGVIPSLSAWEGLNRTATEDDLVKVKELVNKLKHEGIVPGHIEAQMQEAICRGEEDKASAIMAYAEATYPKYQWDAIFIDPVDTIMPNEDTKGRANTFQLKADVIEKLFQFSRNAFGGRGCMVFISAQYGSSAVREIQRIQEKNASGTGENYDDEIESILRRDGNIHSLTTIIEKCDLCIGIATLVKNGEEGMMVRGRDREGGKEWTMYFTVDKDSNYMQERKLSYSRAVEVPKEKVMAAGAIDEEL